MNFILSREVRRLHLSLDGGFIYQLRSDRIEHYVQAISLTASLEASAEVANLVDSGSSPLGLIHSAIDGDIRLEVRQFLFSFTEINEMENPIWTVGNKG